MFTPIGYLCMYFLFPPPFLSKVFVPSIIWTLAISLDYAINTFLSSSAELKRERVFLFLILRESKFRCFLNWPVLTPGSNNRLIGSIMSSLECPLVRHVSLASFSPSPDGWWQVSFTHHRGKWLGCHLLEGKTFSVSVTRCCSLSLFLSCDVSLSVHCYVSRAERQNGLNVVRSFLCMYYNRDI